jgi:cysteine desulfurase
MIHYLDYNATTPVDPRVLKAMLPWFTHKFGNPASQSHPYGWEAGAAVSIAREQVSSLLNCGKEEIIFTSGSTESINLAIKGVAELYATKGDHFITAATEHSAVLDTFDALSRKGKRITVLPVDENGWIRIEDLISSITDQTVMICLMLANNETGVIQPMKEIARIAKGKGIILMSDTTQAVGKIKVDVNELGIDLACVSAHKMYGPKGVGALFVRRKNPRVMLAPLFHGGGHERGFRSGTLNVPGIVGLGKAAEIAANEMQIYADRVSTLRDKLEVALIQKAGAMRNGPASSRLPNTSNLSFPGMPHQLFLSSLKSIAVSAGSACTSGKLEPSHVLKAMGISDDVAFPSIRFSLGRKTSEKAIQAAIKEIIAVVKSLHYL